jgi:hypothetical protein
MVEYIAEKHLYKKTGANSRKIGICAVYLVLCLAISLTLSLALSLVHLVYIAEKHSDFSHVSPHLVECVGIKKVGSDTTHFSNTMIIISRLR